LGNAPLSGKKRLSLLPAVVYLTILRKLTTKISNNPIVSALNLRRRQCCCINLGNMNTSASFPDESSWLNFLNLDLIAPSPRQDTDLLKQLSFVPGLQEILMLRQVHALEHATVWVLGETKSAYSSARKPMNVQFDNESLSGLSTEQGFYLYGDVNISHLRRAVTLAQNRLTNGEWDLAIHPRCGTNLSVSMLLTAGLSIGVYVMLPFRPIEQLIGLGLAATAASELAPDLGAIAQRYITTAIPFNVAVENIILKRDNWGREAHFVKVKWRD
jgi:hypothetical protein